MAAISPAEAVVGSALAPLLDRLPAAPSLAAALRSWDRPVTREIAAWLHRRGLLEIVPV